MINFLILLSIVFGIALSASLTIWLCHYLGILLYLIIGLVAAMLITVIWKEC